jgi:trehalose utilization protein
MIMAASTLRVTIWNEYLHEKNHEAVKAIYPDGIHNALAKALTDRLGAAITVATATLEQPEHGLTDDVLGETDVLLWWGHKAHQRVSDEVVDKVQARVLDGMGLIALHSAHMSKIFTRLMGTSGRLKWRDVGEREIVWCVNPGHPITDGLDDHFEIERAEMYGELFDVPQPDELVFVSWFEGGEVFRSGCCWRRGKGKVFYFRPGHETYPIYYDANVQRVIANAVGYVAAGPGSPYTRQCENSEPLRPIASA